MNDEGFFFLTSMFPASGGVTGLFVDRFESSHLGGQSLERDSSMITAYHGHPQDGKVLAHEFGHLLDLPHVARGSRRANWNLMYEALRAGDELTADQIRRARNSRLARLFAGATGQ